MFWKNLNYKYYCVLIISFALLLTLSIVGIFTHTEGMYRQVFFLANTTYEYEYQVTKSVRSNDYYYASSVLSFYDTQQRERAMYCDIYMLLNDSTYNDESPLYNGRSLGDREIALSENLAKEYSLSIGDVLYSKHRVANQVVAYQIVGILPVCYGLSTINVELNRGIILMGCDVAYLDHISATYVGFSRGDPSVLIQSEGSGLLSITEKDGVVESLLIDVGVEQGIIVAIVTCLLVIYSMFHWRSQKSYYKRLMLYGWEWKTICRAMWVDLTVPAFIALTLACVISCLILSLRNMFFAYITPLFVMVIGFVLLFVIVKICLTVERI